MNLAEVLLATVLGLVVNELCDVSPWIAHRLVRWSARQRYVDSSRAEIRAEELAALINDRPGKLFKLCTAVLFAASAGTAKLRRLVTDRLGRDAARQRSASDDEPTAVVARLLVPTEKLRGEWRYHWAKVLPGLAAGAVMSAAAAAAVALWAPAWTQVGGIAVIAIAGLTWCSAWGIGWYSARSLVVTDKRLLVVRGTLRRKALAIPLEQVTHISYTRTSPAWLNLGTFHLTGDGIPRSLCRLRNIPNPDGIYRYLTEHAPEATRAKITAGRPDTDHPDDMRATLIAHVAAMPDHQLTSLATRILDTRANAD
jgi:hypothetical protein